MTEQKKPARKRRSRSDAEYDRLQRLKGRYIDLFQRARHFGFTLQQYIDARNEIHRHPDYDRATRATRAWLEGYEQYWWDALYADALVFLQEIDGRKLAPEEVNQLFRDNPNRSYAELTGGRHYWGGDPAKPW